MQLTMTRPVATMTAPCPTWCERLHGQSVPGTIHTATVAEAVDVVVTLTQTTVADGILGPASVWTYRPGNGAWALRAVAVRAAGELYTTKTGIPKMNEIGRAYLAAADLIEACPAWCRETHHPSRPIVHRHEIDHQELPDGGFRTVAVQGTSAEPMVVLTAADQRGTAGVDIPPQMAARMAALGRFNGGDRWLSEALKVAAELLGHDVDTPAF